MSQSSNPNVKIKVTLRCGCSRNLYTKYQSERPELGAGEKCDLHGETETASYVLIGQ